SAEALHSNARPVYGLEVRKARAFLVGTDHLVAHNQSSRRPVTKAQRGFTAAVRGLREAATAENGHHPAGNTLFQTPWDDHLKTETELPYNATLVGETPTVSDIPSSPFRTRFVSRAVSRSLSTRRDSG